MTNKREIAQAVNSLKHQAENSLKKKNSIAPQSELFRQRFLKWCFVESEKEHSRDFRLVRTVRDAVPGLFLEYVDKVSVSDQSTLLSALIKRLHGSSSLTEDEKVISERYFEYFNAPFLHHSGALLSSARVSQVQMALQERYLSNPPATLLMKKLLRENLRAHLNNFGLIVVDSPRHLTLSKKVCEWYLVTTFELGGRSQLRYTHTFYADSSLERGTNLSSGLSLLGWLGISTETSWSWLLPEDVPLMVKSVREICLNFLAEADSLVVDIHNPFG